MREWQQTKFKNLVMPDTVYYQSIWAVRDLYRMEEKLEEINQDITQGNIMSTGIVSEDTNTYNISKPTEEIVMHKATLERRVNAIRDAYLPNMKRMAAYQLIYKDLVKRNNELVMMLCKWQGLKATQDMAEGSPVVKANTKNAVKSAFARWKKSMVTGSNGSVHGIGE